MIVREGVEVEVEEEGGPAERASVAVKRGRVGNGGGFGGAMPGAENLGV